MYTPQQGDIVILSDNNVLGKQLVKRVIATAGQTVEIDADGNVLVDGVLLEEDYLKSETELGDVTYPLLVQQGQIFVMGDNRAQSLDSRDSQIGLVDVSEVKGRVLFRLYPFGNFGGVE
jgi:signal peptidase I